MSSVDCLVHFFSPFSCLIIGKWIKRWTEPILILLNYDPGFPPSVLRPRRTFRSGPWSRGRGTRNLWRVDTYWMGGYAKRPKNRRIVENLSGCATSWCFHFKTLVLPLCAPLVGPANWTQMRRQTAAATCAPAMVNRRPKLCRRKIEMRPAGSLGGWKFNVPKK